MSAEKKAHVAVFEPDELDRQIMEIASQAWESNSSLARTLGVSEGTVRHRIKRLREAGVITVRALMNPEVMANQQLAMIAVVVSESHLLESKARELTGLKSVLNVSIISGQYDLMCEVLVDSNHGLVDFLTKELSSISGIQKTESFLVLRSYNKHI